MSGKKELGVVLTPQKTADYIISRLGKIKDIHEICDPCVGPGVFVNSLLKAGVNRNSIRTFDINTEYKSKIDELGVLFQNQDTLLSLDKDLHNKFDFIVGNPPYLNKSSTYIRKNRKKLKKIYGKINAHETYAMFILNGIWRLKEGGKLGFITSDSFLTLRTHAKLRRFILDNCLINEILLAPKNLFANQNVSTSPVIMILTKCTGEENDIQRKENVMKIIPRVKKESDYHDPPIIHEYKQEMYELLPSNLFFSDVEPEILHMFRKASKLSEYLKGFIGMHTHDNKRYIAAIEGTHLAEIFKKRNEKSQIEGGEYKIITKNALNSNDWKPYLKRGGADQYFRPIMEALDWNPSSVKIYDIPNNVPFEEEGIVISGVSSILAARYMPKGCYWDSNKAIGFIVKNPTLSIEYFLGLLNSSLYNYLAKGILNNTSSIQLTTIHALPLVFPEEKMKEEVERLVRQILNGLKRDIHYNYTEERKKIDDLIYNFHAVRFDFSDGVQQKLEHFQGHNQY